MLSWVNRAPHPVKLSVLDYEGRELPMATMQRPEDSLAYNSNERVVWRARAPNGQLMLEYLPQGTEGQTVVVEACAFSHLGAASAVMPRLNLSRAPEQQAREHLLSLRRAQQQAQAPQRAH